MLTSCVTSAYVNALEALTEKQQEKVQVCEKQSGKNNHNGRCKTGKESRCPENGEEMEVRKIEIAMGDCIKSDLERIEEEQKMIDRRNWILLTENVVREK